MREKVLGTNVVFGGEYLKKIRTLSKIAGYTPQCRVICRCTSVANANAVMGSLFGKRYNPSFISGWYSETKNAEELACFDGSEEKVFIEIGKNYYPATAII